MKLADQNILFIARAPMHGGTENVVVQLCELLKPLVNNIVVCAGSGFDREVLKREKIKFYEIPDLENKSISNVVHISKTISNIVKKEKITVIHTHHRMAAFYVTLLNLYKKCCFINTSHNTFYNKKMLTRYSYSNAHLVACGEKVKANLTDEYGLKNVTVIHNAVKPFSGSVVVDSILKKWHDMGYCLVGNVGRLTQQKGVEYFIKSIPMVIKRHAKTKFFIVGSGELESDLKKLASDQGVSEHIVWMGYRKDVQNLMYQFDLVVLSSLWEGLPLTPIESFSVGTPVVATNVDGTPEIVKNNYNGFLVKPKDSKKLAEKIVCAIDMNAKKVMAEAIRKTYDEKFSIKVFNQNYIDYYEKVIKDITSK